MPAQFVCWGLRTNKSETSIVEKEQAFSLYQQMVRIRRFEEELYQLFLNRPMPGSMHQYIGEEAVAVGVCAHLTREDYVTSTHRGHGHCIAKGVDLNAIMAEMFAKKTGCCKGLGGSMHIADFSVGMLGANGIVGAGIPIATGAGWACQLRYPGRVSVVFFGEGAANEGAFHEGLNLASVWKLPVVFVCENNLYNFSVHYKKTMVLDDVADRAVAYGIPGRVVDGMDLVNGLSCRGRSDRARATGEAARLCWSARLIDLWAIRASSRRGIAPRKKWPSGRKGIRFPCFSKYLFRSSRHRRRISRRSMRTSIERSMRP